MSEATLNTLRSTPGGLPGWKGSKKQLSDLRPYRVTSGTITSGSNWTVPVTSPQNLKACTPHEPFFHSLTQSASEIFGQEESNKC